jgi:tetratricopeptide (TPR) repeat protein
MITETTAAQNAVLYARDERAFPSNWTRAVCRALAASNFDDLYLFNSQSLEPSVLFEVARDSGIAENDLQSLNYELDGTDGNTARSPIGTVQWLVRNIAWAPQIQRINLAYCLASLVRYQLAHHVLNQVDVHRLRPNEKYLYYVARFMVSNRLEINEGNIETFAAIQQLIEDGAVSDARALSSASFAIVWHDKTSSLNASLHGWFTALGQRLATSMQQTTVFSEQIALSGFYRAYAMIPARQRDVAATRAAMVLAEQFAEQATPFNQVTEVIATDAKKTVLESSLKEHLYLRADLEAAERTGRELIALDPNWSISYHELAEVLSHAGRNAEALEQYKKALSIGLPRVAFSQYMIAHTLEKLGRRDEALAAYQHTLVLDDSNISAGVCAHNLAKRMKHDSVHDLASKIAAWTAAGHITSDVKELLL